MPKLLDDSWAVAGAVAWGIGLTVPPVTLLVPLGFHAVTWLHSKTPTWTAKRAIKRLQNQQKRDQKRHQADEAKQAKAHEEYLRSLPPPPPPKTVTEQIRELEDSFTVSLEKLDARDMPEDEKLGLRAQLLEWYLERRSQLR